MRIFAALVLSALLPLPAGAGETGWHALGEGSRIRLVTADARDGSGQVWAGLEIELASGTNTYWRVPGESGIPVTVTASAASEGIAIAAIDWPLPVRETVDGVMDYVYREHLVLPFALSGVSHGERLVLEVRLGLCTDVCIPASVTLEHAIDLDAPDLAQRVRIEQARARAPIAYPGEAARDARIGEGGEIVIEGLATEIDAASVIAEREGSATLFDAPRIETAGSVRFAPLVRPGAIDPGASAPAGAVLLTFSTPRGAFEARVPLADTRIPRLDGTDHLP